MLDVADLSDTSGVIERGRNITDVCPWASVYTHFIMAQVR